MKHCSPITSSPSGNLSSHTNLSFKNVFTPVIRLRVDGRDNVPLRFRQFPKAPYSISITPSGMFREPLIPDSPIALVLITLSVSGKTKFVNVLFFAKQLSGSSSSSPSMWKLSDVAGTNPFLILTSFKLTADSEYILSRIKRKSMAFMVPVTFRFFIFV